MPRWHRALMVAVGLLASLGATDLCAADIEGVRAWRSPDSTRLVFDLSQPVSHRIFSLSNPERLVIDIDNATMSANTDALELDNTPVQRLRHAPKDQKNLRIVLDLSAEVTPRSFSLGKNEQYGNRLVIDLDDKAKVAETSIETVLAQQKPSRDIVIAIDAGHGGEDPGAIGPGKLQEKQVVMQISQKLKAMIDREPGFSAVLVRTGDYYVEHRKRTTIARTQMADFFVSIHADAFSNPQANGAGVYALSLRGATSETARFLAQRENQADLIGGAGSVNLGEVDAMVAELLVDLSMTSTVSSSLDAGSYVLRHLGKVTRLHKKSVEQAGFLVLKSPDMPSLLVETGFISNPAEARKLSQAAHQTAIANAIFSGLRDYFESKPPVGTWLANNGDKREKIYVISSGDTLSGIAARHSVSLNQLLSYNNLSSRSVIKVGQQIKIPPSRS